MGEAKRRKKLDPNWGKPKSMIDETLPVYFGLFKPSTTEGKKLIELGLVNFYRTALLNSEPGITMLDCSQGTEDHREITEDLEQSGLFQGTPVLMSSKFMALAELAEQKIPKLDVNQIKNIAIKTDFRTDRIMVSRLGVGSQAGDLIMVVPVEKIEISLKTRSRE